MNSREIDPNIVFSKTYSKVSSWANKISLKSIDIDSSSLKNETKEAQ